MRVRVVRALREKSRWTAVRIWRQAGQHGAAGQVDEVLWWRPSRLPLMCSLQWADVLASPGHSGSASYLGHELHQSSEPSLLMKSGLFSQTLPGLCMID